MALPFFIYLLSRHFLVALAGTEGEGPRTHHTYILLATNRTVTINYKKHCCIQLMFSEGELLRATISGLTYTGSTL